MSSGFKPNFGIKKTQWLIFSHLLPLCKSQCLAEYSCITSVVYRKYRTEFTIQIEFLIIFFLKRTFFRQFEEKEQLLIHTAKVGLPNNRTAMKSFVHK